MKRAAALLLVLLAFGADGARADNVTKTQLRDLAAVAKESPAARERLLRVDRVDGRPADVRSALDGAEGRDLERRLDEIAAGARGSSGARGDATGAAREIVDDGRYTGTDLPRPFQAFFEWLGDLLAPVVAFFEDLVNSVPGPPGLVYALLGAALVAVGVLLFLRIASRRAGRAGAAAEDKEAVAVDDASRLERDAAEAERAGDYERAVRLRFRAGLLRLDRRGAIEYRPSLTTGEVAATLRSRPFDDVGTSFDRIVYGQVPAAEDDARASREGWHEVLAGVPERREAEKE